MPNYDLMQSIFAISLAAGRAENVRGTRDQITDFLEKAVDRGGEWRGRYGSDGEGNLGVYAVKGFLRDVGPNLKSQDWTLVWGPSVFWDSGKGGCLANGMFVAHSAAENTYVVAIAATNFISNYATSQEDYDNHPDHMVNFPIRLDRPISQQHTTADAGRPQLTGGTALGVHILCTQMPDRRTGRSVVDYLKSAPKTPGTKLVFAGHSLAGALAPAMALQLRTELGHAGYIVSNILVFATAGATPGNGAFATEWHRNFFGRQEEPGLNPANGFRAFNLLYRNHYDFVPHAFTNINGPPPAYWNRYDDTKKYRMETLVGVCEDILWCPIFNGLYEEHQGWGVACGLQSLSDAAHDGSFVGTLPVNYWDNNGQRETYRAFPTSPVLYIELGKAMGMAHMGQYYNRAGIDPWNIEPVVSPAM